MGGGGEGVEGNLRGRGRGGVGWVRGGVDEPRWWKVCYQWGLPIYFQLVAPRGGGTQERVYPKTGAPKEGYTCRRVNLRLGAPRDKGSLTMGNTWIHLINFYPFSFLRLDAWTIKEYESISQSP